jgi:hypothetical protein
MDERGGIMSGFLLLLAGCTEFDHLDGQWGGDMVCGGRDFTSEMQVSQTSSFEYAGEMLLKYTEEESDGNFYANFLYSFTVVQPLAAGAQDLLFNMKWADLGCKTVSENGEETLGGCQAHGIDTTDLESRIGDVPMRFDGRNRLSLDDGNCTGILRR